MSVTPKHPSGQTLRTGGRLWGERRVRAGISLAALASESGIGKGLISLMENGRLFPSDDEYDRITLALDRLDPREAA